jgi:hypothetical protein
MKNATRIAGRLTIILIAALCVAALIWPLQSTSWADSVRAMVDEDEQGSGPAIHPVLRSLLIVAKQAVTLVATALLTLGVRRWLSKRKSR